MRHPDVSESRRERLHGLDHLRAAAILLVMVFHYGDNSPVWLQPAVNIGWSGVDLFFVLSGYLIGHQLLREIQCTGSISFGRFFGKRALRIIPAYLAVLTLYFAVPALREGSGLPPLWRFLTFSQNIGLDVQTQKSFSHAWSLCIEEQFYIVLPIMLMTIFSLKLQKGTAYLIAALFLVGMLLRFYSWDSYVRPLADAGSRLKMFYSFLEKVYYPTYTRMDGLTVGVSIAALANFRPRIMGYVTAHGNAVLLGGVALLGVGYGLSYRFVSLNTAVFGFPLISLAFGLLVMAALSPSSLLYKFKSGVTSVIAMLSYALYLTHKQLFHVTKTLLQGIGPEGRSTWLFLAAFLIAGLGGLLLHLIVERPFLRMRDTLLPRVVHAPAE